MESGSVRLMTIYRPPNGDYDLFLETLTHALDAFSRSDSVMFVSGDFNVYFHMCMDQRSTLILDTFRSFGFSLTYMGLTRNNHCLDNIFTNINTSKLRTQSVDTKLSDHLGIHILKQISSL